MPPALEVAFGDTRTEGTHHMCLAMGLQPSLGPNPLLWSWLGAHEAHGPFWEYKACPTEPDMDPGLYRTQPKDSCMELS